MARSPRRHLTTIWPARSATTPDGKPWTRRRRPSRRALRLLARRADDAPARGRAHSAALSPVRPRNVRHVSQREADSARSRRRGGSPIDFPVEPRKGLCLIGPPGIGKTHLAVAVLRQRHSHAEARAACSTTTRDLLRVIRSTYNPLVRTAEMDVLRPVMEADLLVLDDIGSREDVRVGRRDDEPHRQHALQRAPAHDLHVELRGHAATTTIPTACKARDRVPHPLAAARDVRVPRVRRRRLPPPAAQRRGRRSGDAVEASTQAGARCPAAPRDPCARSSSPRRELGWSGGKAGS